VFIAGGLNMLAFAATWTPPDGTTARVSAAALLVGSLLADQTQQHAGASGRRSASVSPPGQLEGVLVALRPAASTWACQNFCVRA
jgi:hypothetical protein